MTLQSHHKTAFWLVVSVGLLSSLIPGGPVENRDFSHIHPAILGAFNIFLTVLDLGSLVLAFFAARQRRLALKLAFAAAIAFFGVYAIDLAQIFPRSPTPMSFALALIEVLGMTAAIPLMFVSRRALAELGISSKGSATSYVRYPMLAALFVIGGVVVWYATAAAMGSDVIGAVEAASPLRMSAH